MEMDWSGLLIKMSRIPCLSILLFLTFIFLSLQSFYRVGLPSGYLPAGRGAGLQNQLQRFEPSSR